MKVLIADPFESWGIDELRASGCDVVCEPKLSGDALRDALARTGPSVLVVRGTQVTADMLEASPHLSAVIRAGAGYNTIDVAAASRRSIFVANCPGKNAVAVAELTFGLILALDRRIVENVADLRNGVWNKKEYSQARGLKGRTLGVLGMGQIGREVVRRAHAFDMPVVAWSRFLTPALAEELDVRRCETPAEVAAACDVLSIHLAAAKETKGLVNADLLGRLRPGSYVVNTARADVVDYAALADAASQRGIRVAVDVYPGEPETGQGTFTAAILKAGGIVYGTHHIGALTDQAQSAIAAETVRLIRVYAETGRVENCVNVSPRLTTRYLLTVRHHNQPGVLAHVLSHLGQARINVEEMENVILSGKQTACARIHLDREPSAEALKAIESGCEHIVGVGLAEVPV